MRTFVLFALASFCAQLVDGSLGMAYGVTSTTILLTAGIAPAAASASVHLAQIGTAVASGASHWRFGNVDWPMVLRLGLPGAIGAFVGATLLSSVSTDAAAPWMSFLLIVLGGYVLLRFSVRDLRPQKLTGVSPKLLLPLGLVAGFMDATGGGGWGPVSTPTLLSTGRVTPRRVVGSVDTSELFVAVAASAGFLVGLGHAGVDWLTVVAMLVGGVAAAPLAAWLVRIVPTRLIGVGAGGLIVLTNVRMLLPALELPTAGAVLVYVLLLAGWAIALGSALHGTLRQRRNEGTESPAGDETELTPAR